MNKVWIKRLAAGLLAALLAVSPVLAEENPPQDLPAVVAESAEAFAEQGEIEIGAELPGDDVSTGDITGEVLKTAEPDDGEPAADGDSADERPGAEAARDGEAPEADPEAPGNGDAADENIEPTGEDAEPVDGAAEPSDENAEATDGDTEPADENAEPADEAAEPAGEGASDGETEPTEESPSDGETEGEDAEATPGPDATPAPTVLAEATAAPKLEAAPALRLAAETLNLGLKEKYTLTAVSLPEGAAGVSFQSSDPGVAAVEADTGRITAAGYGSAVVTATAGDQQAACTVNVLKAPRKLSLSKAKLTLGVGQAATLTASLPAGTASQITWKSSKPAVAVVDAQGNVTAQGRGKAKITGYTFNGKKAVCQVTVKPAPTWMTATLDAEVFSVGQVRTIAVAMSKGSKASTTVTSSDPGVAAVDGTAFAAVAPGTATITVVTHNGLRADLPVTVVPAPTAVGLPEEELALGKGEKRVLTPAFEGNAPADVTWVSSKPKVVSVSAKGKLAAKRRGTAIITLTTHNGLSASCTVYVVKAPSKVTVKPGKKLAMGLGETVRLTGKLPKGASSVLSWTSAAPGVASVDAQGNVTALSPGSAKITVRTFNGKKAACKVTVAAAPVAVAFTNAADTLAVGMTLDLKPVVNPGSAGSVALSSDNPGVLAVSGTKVTAAAPGSATVTATTYNGVSCTTAVNVVPAPTAVGLGVSTLTMGVGEKFTLSPAVDPGSVTAFTFKSSKKGVAGVSGAGTIKAKKKGSATVTVTTHNGLKAKVKVKVVKAPSKVTLKPAAVALEPGGSYQLTVRLPKGTASTVTFASSNPGVVAVDGSGLLYAVQPGSATVTATTFNKKKATCKVTVASDVGAAGPLRLSSSGMVMLRTGATWSLTAASDTGSVAGIKWSTTSSAIAKIKASGGACTVTAAGAGTAIVSAKLPDGNSASVIVMGVNVSDLSAANFNNVQKALLAHEDLVTGAQGGNVIWDMISARLLKAGYAQSRVNTMIASLKAADATYRNIYIYSFGTYNFVGSADVSASYYDPGDNTLYISGSTAYSDTNFAYVAFHESGHAIDYNADGNGQLNSLNDAATSAVLNDVRGVLAARVNSAIVSAGVSASAVDAGKVVDALMNYKTLLHEDEVLGALNDAERAVYSALANAVSSEMNQTLPINNGCMVWDAVEGATNFAVSGQFGHAYLLRSSEYEEAAKYYFYDRQGTPAITTEPWAEFFSANIMGDSGTLSLNWSYLPQTCKYFAETLAPTVLNYFTDYIKSL